MLLPDVSVRVLCVVVAAAAFSSACGDDGGSGDGSGDVSDGSGSDASLDDGTSGDADDAVDGGDEDAPDASDTACVDSDDDGVCDDGDACPGADDSLDDDGDLVPDGCDICPAGDDGDDSDGDLVPDACDIELSELRITPADALVEVELGDDASIDFVATAIFSDGSERDVTEGATWTVDSPAFGAFAGGTLQTPTFDTIFLDSALVGASYTDDDGAGTVEATTYVTVAAYRQTGTQTDLLFVLPFLDPTGFQTGDLAVDTVQNRFDVFFNADTTGSMDGEISNLQSSLDEIVIPAITSAADDVWFGVGAYEDFPVAPFGEPDCYYGALDGPDQPFELFSEMSPDKAVTQAAVGQLAIAGNAIGCGNDTPESAIEAMYQIATGEGLAEPAPTNVPANSSGIGGVGFREDAVPVIVNITDAVSHYVESDPACTTTVYSGAVAAAAHGEVETLEALGAICAQVIQISTESGNVCSAVTNGITWTQATGAVVAPAAWDVIGRPESCGPDLCCTGLGGAGVAPIDDMCPLTFIASGTGTGVDTAISDAFELLARFALIDVSREWTGEAVDNDGITLPLGTTTADFINVVQPTSYGELPAPGFAEPQLTAESFTGVVPGTELNYGVSVFNDFMPQGAAPRHVIVPITFVANNCRTLEERNVLVVVPRL
jgi:hypothetical protein